MDRIVRTRYGFGSNPTLPGFWEIRISSPKICRKPKETNLPQSAAREADSGIEWGDRPWDALIAQV
ncbi:MAG: hypothetical protein ACOYME_03260 [Prochlorotrichaceae cyanobacterium]